MFENLTTKKKLQNEAYTFNLSFVYKSLFLCVMYTFFFVNKTVLSNVT